MSMICTRIRTSTAGWMTRISDLRLDRRSSPLRLMWWIPACWLADSTDDPVSPPTPGHASIHDSLTPRSVGAGLLANRVPRHMGGVWHAAFASKPAPTEVHRSTIRLMPNSRGVSQDDPRHAPTPGHGPTHDSRHAPIRRSRLAGEPMARSHLCCLVRRVRPQPGSMMRPRVNTRSGLSN